MNREVASAFGDPLPEKPPRSGGWSAAPARAWTGFREAGAAQARGVSGMVGSWIEAPRLWWEAWRGPKAAPPPPAPKPVPSVAAAPLAPAAPVPVAEAVAEPGEPAELASAKAGLEPGDYGKILDRIESWRQAWCDRDLDGYAACLHERFQDMHGNKRATFLWRQRDLFQSKTGIWVEVRNLEVKAVAKGMAKAQFLMEYRDEGGVSRKQSTSVKTVILREDQGEWLIVKA